MILETRRSPLKKIRWLNTYKNWRRVFKSLYSLKWDVKPDRHSQSLGFKYDKSWNNFVKGKVLLCIGCVLFWISVSNLDLFAFELNKKQFGDDAERESIVPPTSTSTSTSPPPYLCFQGRARTRLSPFFLWQNHQHHLSISITRPPREVWWEKLWAWLWE